MQDITAKTFSNKIKNTSMIINIENIDKFIEGDRENEI